ncbi:hypothetical protein AVL61_00680 [Kocuria rosea subsp. polaris]|uniref:Uncharacterized protein n=1 Tax=Kocuria rosea subsp. polaris TaxID=136273 RepID=A0A0W8INF5_KOCRO|nr:hypothetical protein AVL61_00680 [Kocuria polaris]
MSRIGRHSTSKELIMIAFLFLLTATAAVLAVYTVIGRLAVPAEERVPWRDLGWDGWRQTLRRSLVFLGDSAPSDGARFRRVRRPSSPADEHVPEARISRESV